MTSDQQFEMAERAAGRAAMAIERTVVTLLEDTGMLDCVARDFVVERLMAQLIQHNPAAMDYLNKQSGVGTMRLMNAVMDWFDGAAER
jgi:hypothetical protein